MTLIAYLLAFLAAGLSALTLVRVRSLATMALWMPKALAGSAASFLALMGALGAALGLLSSAPLAIASGLLGALLSLRYARRVTAPHDGFARAFGPGWQDRIPPALQGRMLQRRWQRRLPVRRGARWERDVPFWTEPGSGRELLCDLWRPPPGLTASGLAFVYLHGGAWHWMDKDFGTRPLFRHLASQGHLVMDVAYRLCPEVDIQGMAGDVKRAVAWIKANAGRYGLDPRRVVLAGGSTGVPSVCVEFPGTEHGFDLLLPRYAPAAQAALYDLDRFLALMT